VERARIAQIVELIVENDEHEQLDSVGTMHNDEHNVTEQRSHMSTAFGGSLLLQDVEISTGFSTGKANGLKSST